MDTQAQVSTIPERITLNSAADPFDAAESDPVVTERTTDLTGGAIATAADIAADAQAAADARALTAGEQSTEADAPAGPAVETPPEAATQSPDLMAKIEQLARQDRRLREERQQAKAMRAEAEAKVAEINKFHADLQALKGNPIELAKFAGLDVRDLIRASLGEEATPKTEIEILQEKLDKQEKWQLEQTQRLEQAQQRAQEAEQARRINDLLLTAETGCKAAGEEFELINVSEDYQRVLDTQIEYFSLHKVPLDWRTAATYVEQALEKEARRYAGTKKISAGLTPATTAQKPQAQSVATPQQAIPGSRTITHRPVAAPNNNDAPERITLNSSYVDRDESIDHLAQALAAANRAKRA